ncbi:hypothetical protein F4809DRAFT_641744 [Biscogniauxia mediterranea]|nr:hypothetical protein F4809DRAFT_641744 [Biscogniauxia mediterranea]
MRFILVVGATLLSMVAALPPQGESMPLLQPRCLASGVDCTADPNSCCSGLCAEDHGCGCYTCT